MRLTILQDIFLQVTFQNPGSQTINAFYEKGCKII
uniref:Uncharacterized protein n=1 Tax=Arundo donax TaxID=35708 RepID=A0A0A9E2A8_ARUDO